jgi:hypothetical protein
MFKKVNGIVIALTVILALTTPAGAAPADKPLDVVRFATFNASLNRNFAGQLISDLSTPNNLQAKTVAEIIQRVQPGAGEDYSVYHTSL